MEAGGIRSIGKLFSKLFQNGSQQVDLLNQEEKTVDAESNKLLVTKPSTLSLQPIGVPEPYLETMALIVRDSFTAAGQNLPLAEVLVKAKVWSELLCRIVPESRLQECFDLAFRRHESSYPVNAYDLKRAWEELIRHDKPQWQIDRDNCETCDEEGHRPGKDGRYTELCKHDGEPLN